LFGDKTMSGDLVLILIIEHEHQDGHT
jgi:hypothetical protein